MNVFGWKEPSETTVPILTEAFGTAPTTTVFDASAPLPRTEYAWGGFVLQVDAFTEQSDTNAATLVHTRTASVGGVAIRMANGLAVGSSRAAALAARLDPSSTPDGLNFDAIDFGGGMMNYVTATLTGSSVSSIDSPIHNYGY